MQEQVYVGIGENVGEEAETLKQSQGQAQGRRKVVVLMHRYIFRYRCQCAMVASNNIEVVVYVGIRGSTGIGRGGDKVESRVSVGVLLVSKTRNEHAQGWVQGKMKLVQVQCVVRVSMHVPCWCKGARCKCTFRQRCNGGNDCGSGRKSAKRMLRDSNRSRGRSGSRGKGRSKDK
jgi:hypothetical protein